jgi:hypothetical protein
MNLSAAEQCVTSIVWVAAGSPVGDGAETGQCRVCGEVSVGIPFNSWVRSTFTDFDKMQQGTVICHACQFSFCERSELLARLVGKEKHQRMRNYSHFVVDDEWIPLSKGNKARMREILLNETPQVAVVAESGQKHIVFRAIPSVVQFEETQIRDLSMLAPLLESVERLYNGGFSKTEIVKARYKQYRILAFGVTEWQAQEQILSPFRQSAIFALALFLAQKEDT